MKLLKALLSDSSGLSCMRAMSLLSCCFACILAAYGIYNKCELSGIAELCGVFLAAGFGGKVAQKHLETRSNEDPPS